MPKYKGNEFGLEEILELENKCDSFTGNAKGRKMENNIVVIYHDHCSDGIAAAWCFYRVHPKAQYYAAKHDGTPPPDVTGKEVYIVDFSYDKETLLDIKSKAKSLVLLDHHKSAMEKLGSLDFCTFDMKRSGAGMAWDYVYPGKPRHWLINYTEDKDLWRWAIPDSREVNAALQSYPLTFDSMDKLSQMQPFDLKHEGAAILRANQNMVDGIVKKARDVIVQDYVVPVVNSGVLQSEVCNYLAKNRPFAVAWFENEIGERVYSLRSTDGGVDVSHIAGHYPNGGGHARAAGFRLKPGENL